MSDVRYRLCALADIPEGTSKGFGHPAPTTEARDPRGLFVIRRDGRVYAYRNRCPHRGLELNWVPDRFLDRDGALILCSAHGALFEIDNGRCISGPCHGQLLEVLATEVVGGEVYITLPPPDSAT